MNARAAVHLVASIALGACSVPGANSVSSVSSVVSPAVRPAAAEHAVTPFDIADALDRLGATPLWPGFEPLRSPVAIYDGTNTVLFRHPFPPAPYVSLSRRRETAARQGRDPLVTSNSSVDLAGVPTATVLLTQSKAQSADDWAALTIHELFHVFQRARHPSWMGNEVDLFTYPTEDTTALAQRREESMALGRALAASSTDSVRCWVRAALGARSARYARLGAASAAYERGTELNEGLAQYVERRAGGKAVTLRADEFPADGVRLRAYETGAALATLLDRLDSRWRETLEAAPADSGMTLDGLLARSVMRDGGGTCAPSAVERTAFLTRAAADVDTLVARHRAERERFLAQPGWRVVIESAQPLFPQRFDPWNVSRVSQREVLHSRFLRMGNAAGSVETLDRAALTQGRAGAHPLFGGVHVETITGLPHAPSMSDSAGTLILSAAGVTGRMRGARVDTAGQTVQIRLP
jgi:hypothetical protein